MSPLSAAMSAMMSSGSPADHMLDRRLTDNTALDISPLPLIQHRGLIAISVMAFLSFLATGGLLCFITYRLVFWRRKYTRYIGYNQYIILIFNLVLADFQQSLAFLICIKWVATNEIKSGTPGCFLQGLWLQIGDPGSGLFVLAIAFHTFLLVVWGYKMPYNLFVAFVCAVWVFVALIVIIPLGLYGADVYVPSGAWCWINSDHEAVRLWTHYIWIFLAEFGTVVLYAIMYLQLRRQIAASAILGTNQIESLKRLRRVVGYMTIYPLVYIILSLPLAAGRMASAHGDNPSLTFFCCAGAIITTSGLVDVVLYTLTRRSLIIDSEDSHNLSYNKFPSKGGRNNNLTSVTADLRSPTSKMDTRERDGSTDNIVQPGVEMTPMGKVYQETTIEITSEPAPSDGDGASSSSKEDYTQPPSRMWRR